MQYFWVTFQNGSAEKIIEKFVTELIVDGSYSDVRKTVYQGLTQLLSCTEAHDLLKGVLPSLGGFIHDENQSVRQAFVGMLIKIKEMKCNIKYWHVVDIYNFALRLAVSGVFVFQFHSISVIEFVKLTVHILKLNK